MLQSLVLNIVDVHFVVTSRTCSVSYSKSTHFSVHLSYTYSSFIPSPLSAVYHLLIHYTTLFTISYSLVRCSI